MAIKTPEEIKKQKARHDDQLKKNDAREKTEYDGHYEFLYLECISVKISLSI